MDRTQYMQLRAQLNFDKNRNYLFQHIFIDFGLLLSACWVTWAPTLFLNTFLPAAILGLVYFRAFALMHEAVHGLAHPNPRVNQWIGKIYGVFCFLPYSLWREIHLQHHLWSGNIDRDPSMRLVRELKDQRVRGLGLLRFAWASWLPLMAFMQHTVFWKKSWELSRGNFKKQLEVLFLVLWWFMVIVVFVVAQSVEVLIISLGLYLLMVEIVNFPHHLDLPQYEGERRTEVWDQHALSRSCVYPAWLASVGFLNFNYHVEHHMFPTLPWHQLTKARILVKDILGANYNEDDRNEWIVAHRKLDLVEVFVWKNKSDPTVSDKSKITLLGSFFNQTGLTGYNETHCAGDLCRIGKYRGYIFEAQLHDLLSG